MDGVLRDQARRQLLGERRVALMVDEGQLELGAALVRQAFGRGQRQIAQLGMFVVDDFGGDFRRRLRCLPGGRRVAGERPQNADLDGLGGLPRPPLWARLLRISLLTTVGTDIGRVSMRVARCAMSQRERRQSATYPKPKSARRKRSADAMPEEEQ